MKYLHILLLAPFMCCTTSYADVYKFTTNNGRVGYTDDPKEFLGCFPVKRVIQTRAVPSVDLVSLETSMPKKSKIECDKLSADYEVEIEAIAQKRKIEETRKLEKELYKQRVQETAKFLDDVEAARKHKARISD